MLRSRIGRALLASALLASCDSGTDIEFIDFSGTWTVDLILPVPEAQAVCGVSGVNATISQTGPAFNGSMTGGTLVCTRGTETAPSETMPTLSITAGAAGPTGTDEQDAIAFMAAAGSTWSLSFAGAPVSGGVVDFAGAVTGTMTVAAFDIGTTTVTGTWDARR